jgi:hypothetical protein
MEIERLIRVPFKFQNVKTLILVVCRTIRDGEVTVSLFQFSRPENLRARPASKREGTGQATDTS